MLTEKLASFLKNASLLGLAIATTAAPSGAGIRHDSRFISAQPCSVCSQTLVYQTAGAILPGYPSVMQVIPHATQIAADHSCGCGTSTPMTYGGPGEVIERYDSQYGAGIGQTIVGSDAGLVGQETFVGGIDSAAGLVPGDAAYGIAGVPDGSIYAGDALVPGTALATGAAGGGIGGGNGGSTGNVGGFGGGSSGGFSGGGGGGLGSLAGLAGLAALNNNGNNNNGGGANNNNNNGGGNNGGGGTTVNVNNNNKATGNGGAGGNANADATGGAGGTGNGGKATGGAGGNGNGFGFGNGQANANAGGAANGNNGDAGPGNGKMNGTSGSNYDGMFSNPQEPVVYIPVNDPSDPGDPASQTGSSGGGLGYESSSDAPVVPEPGSMLMLAVGSCMGGMAWLRRRRKAKTEA